MSKYRDQCIDGSIVQTMYEANGLFEVVVSVCGGHNFKQMDRDYYLEWVKSWKKAYELITKVSRDIKKNEQKFNQSDVHASLHHVRVLANTLLNARQYAKDVRRSVTE